MAPTTAVLTQVSPLPVPMAEVPALGEEALRLPTGLRHTAGRLLILGDYFCASNETRCRLLNAVLFGIYNGCKNGDGLCHHHQHG